MDVVEQKFDCGVLIGRFQVDRLTKAHKRLIGTVLSKHKKVILLLGVAPLPNSWRDPLDYQTRHDMIVEEFPDILVLPVSDIPDDKLWSQAVDRAIEPGLSYHHTAALYGGRDSFIKHYTGRHETIELEQVSHHSGTEHRRLIAARPERSRAFRAGVIYASQQHYPTIYPTVDVAVFSPDGTKILLGKKTHDPLWRLPGGFADPSSDSNEEDAIREVEEETGLKLQSVTYVTSRNIQDWRYAAEPHSQIRTTMFYGIAPHEDAVAGDDLAEVQWFNLADLDPAFTPIVMPEHRGLAHQAILNFKYKPKD